MAGLFLPQLMSFNEGNAALTAGTTQTYAGATPVTNLVNTCTTGNVSDGYKLPYGASGQTVLMIMSANAAKLYPPPGGTINAAAADAALTMTASKTSWVFYADPKTIYVTVQA